VLGAMMMYAVATSPAGTERYHRLCLSVCLSVCLPHGVYHGGWCAQWMPRRCRLCCCCCGQQSMTCCRRSLATAANQPPETRDVIGHTLAARTAYMPSVLTARPYCTVRRLHVPSQLAKMTPSRHSCLSDADIGLLGVARSRV